MKVGDAGGDTEFSAMVAVGQKLLLSIKWVSKVTYTIFQKVAEWTSDGKQV